MPDLLGLLSMSRTGAELLLGNFILPINETVRTDTAAAHGEAALYRVGATLHLQVFDKVAGAWRETTLS